MSAEPLSSGDVSAPNPLFTFIFDNCGTHWLRHQSLFTAHITICGYDYYCLAKTELDAKLDLCNMLMKSRYILENFKTKP